MSNDQSPRVDLTWFHYTISGVSILAGLAFIFLDSQTGYDFSETLVLAVFGVSLIMGGMGPAIRAILEAKYGN